MVSRDTFTAVVPMEMEEDELFQEWLDQLDGSQFVRIETALEVVRQNGIMTSVKDLGHGLYEKKWTSGLRLYFSVIEKPGRITLLLLGSGKGREQARAIEQARRSLAKYTVSRISILKKD